MAAALFAPCGVAFGAAVARFVVAALQHSIMQNVSTPFLCARLLANLKFRF
jgi:hypothetical protein